MIPRSVLTLIGRLTLGARPLEAVAKALAPLAPIVRGTPSERSRAVAARRRRGHGGPWLPPWVARWLRSPGCRQYAVVLADDLRRAGHPAQVVLGSGTVSAHVWVECAGVAYDLARPEGISPEAMGRDFPLQKTLDGRAGARAQ